MSDLSAQSAALLRRIATPEVSGVPGALGDEHLPEIGPLMIAAYVAAGLGPITGHGEQPSAAHAWVKPTAAGLAWLEAHPA